MNSAADVLSLTSSQYADHVAMHFQGKGSVHAVEIYKSLMKRGMGFHCHNGTSITFDPSFIDRLSSFATAQKLKEWCKLDLQRSLSLMPLSKLIQDDETTKILFKTPEGYEIESVLIRMQSKNTLCISSQVGCKMGCAFCETGRMGLLRNLSVSEIVQQVYIARHILKQKIDNIVFMGMGEPFDNYDSVLQAVSVLTDMQGLAFGLKNITISTSGKVQEIRRFTYETHRPTPNLAVSLNAPVDALRTKLMPHNRKEPLHELVEAIEMYIQTKNKDVLLAYVLLRGVNDADDNAKELAQLIARFKERVKINLIPYNPQSCDKFQPPENDVIERFAALLRSLGVRVLLRRTKGRSIMAGCGQLGNVELRKKKSAPPPSLSVISE